MKNLKWTTAVLLLLVFAMALSACSGNGNEGNTGGGGETVDLNSVFEALHGYQKEILLQDGSFSEADFADRNLPGYVVENLKKGDDGFDDYVGYLGLDPDAVDAVLHVQPMMNTRAENMLVILASDRPAVETSLKTYHEGQDSIWSTYLPDQYELVKQNVSGSKGNVVYYITHEQAGDLADVITESVK